ncbi:MAG: hypothetical protein FWG83_03960 [Oscillospiraceae bacterium]|nr:hypothetical protein [Oscillospiraceae bacterium]
MSWFSNWWGALELVEQILCLVAIPSSLFLVVQGILIVVGGGDSGGLDTDVDFNLDGDVGLDGDFDLSDCSSGGGDSRDFGIASMFTLQGVASFFCVFGWGAFFMYRGGLPLLVAVILAFALGLAVMYALAKAVLYLNRLSHSGTLEIKNLLGNMGTVYLKIPPKGEGRGKVTVQTSERFVEFDAVSEIDTVIPNNAEVRVIDILGENVLVVETV